MSVCTQNTFSKNGESTIVVRQAGVDIGQRRALSVGDIVQTRLLYKCPSQSALTRSFLHIDLNIMSAIVKRCVGLLYVGDSYNVGARGGRGGGYSGDLCSTVSLTTMLKAIGFMKAFDCPSFS